MLLLPILLINLVLFILWKSHIDIETSGLFLATIPSLLALLFMSTLVFDRLRVDYYIYTYAFIYILAFIISFYSTSFGNLYQILMVPITLIFSLQVAHLIDKKALHRILVFMTVFLLAFFIYNYTYSPSSLWFSYVETYARSDRYTLGFVKPSYAAEYLLIIVYIALLSFKHRIVHALVVSLIFMLLLMIDSRAALLSLSVLYVNLYWGSLLKSYRLTLLIFIIVMLYLSLFGYKYPDKDSVDLLSSGRIKIWLIEIDANLHSIWDLLLGNISPTVYFEYSSDRDSEKFHIDSFYVEYFIRTGLLGLSILYLIVHHVHSCLEPRHKSIFVSILVYGIFENSILSMTSLFGLFSLLLVFQGFDQNNINRRVKEC